MNRIFSILTGASSPDGGLGLLMSILAGIAAALAVAIMLTVCFGLRHRSLRDPTRRWLAAVLAPVLALGLFAFALSDMRHAAFDFLGINAAKPSVEFEIRLPEAALAAISDTQVELHTDRNQKLARVKDLTDEADGRRVLRGIVTLDYRTADRTMVLNLPDRETFEFKLRLAANPSRSEQFGPWHLVDRIGSASESTPVAAHDAFAIRYRVH
jgi:hypothetical protein